MRPRAVRRQKARREQRTTRDHVRRLRERFRLGENAQGGSWRTLPTKSAPLTLVISVPLPASARPHVSAAVAAITEAAQRGQLPADLEAVAIAEDGQTHIALFTREAALLWAKEARLPSVERELAKPLPNRVRVTLLGVDDTIYFVGFFTRSA